MKNNQIPEIRFTGYTEDWEQRKLDSIVDRVKSYSLSRDVETSENTGYKYIHYGDIHTKVANIIDESSNLPNIKAGNYELLEKGDLVLADASEDYQGIATPAVITIDVPYKLVSGLHTIALRPKQVDSLFLYYLINSPTFRKYGYRTGTGMKVFGISVTNLLKFESMFPILEEQTKIASFLKHLDDTIALHQQELTTLEQTKQGFLQKMFPKKEEYVPEVRFPGFTGDWEQHKIGEIFKVTRGQVLAATETCENKTEEMPYPVYSSQTKNNGLMGYYKDYLFDTAITWTTDGANAGTVNYRDGKFYSTNVNGVLLSDEGYANKAVAEALNLVTWKYVSRVGNPKLMNNIMSDIVISLPVAIEEQNKISEFLESIDHLISIHQRELDALKETKKAFLQKMFV